MDKEGTWSCPLKASERSASLWGETDRGDYSVGSLNSKCAKTDSLEEAASNRCVRAFLY